MVFANWADQRLWLASPGQVPVAPTAAPSVACGDRYADPAVLAGGRVAGS